MFYAEINSEGKCFHVTDNERPLSDTVIAVDDFSVLGKIWDGEKFVEDLNELIPEEPKTTQLDNIEAGVNSLLETYSVMDVLLGVDEYEA